MITQPMTAGSFGHATDAEINLGLANMKYPVYATPKFDGIRSLMIKGKLVSRKFLAIPNDFIKAELACIPDGLDGELVFKDFNATTSAVMSEDGEPDFEFHIFDYVKDDLKKAYPERMKDLEALELPKRCVKILPIKCHNADEVKALEDKWLAEDMEGAMVRTADSPYKCGRSTAKQGWLMKVKRFMDDECKITGYYEEMKNTNKAEKDELGHTKRSSAKDGKVGKGMLGGIEVVAINGPFEGVSFKIGGIGDHALRKELWADKESLIGRIVKFKHQWAGHKDKPRIPKFLGFRDERDMD